MSNIYVAPSKPASPHSRLMVFLLCFFLGYLGVHRFVVGKIGSGLLYLCTGGLFYIGWLVDLIVILAGGFTDDRGLVISDWNGYSGPQPVVQSYQQPYTTQQPYQPSYPSGMTYQPTSPQPTSQTKNVKYCQTCGSVNELSATYCASCGAAIEN